MLIFSLLQLIGGLIVSLSYLPQIKQILWTKSVKDLNLKSFIFLAIGLFLMEIYGFYLFIINGIGMFLLTNSLGLGVIIFMIILILKYRGGKDGKKEK